MSKEGGVGPRSGPGIESADFDEDEDELEEKIRRKYKYMVPTIEAVRDCVRLRRRKYRNLDVDGEDGS